MKFLVIGSRKKICKAILDAGHECLFVYPENLVIDIQSKKLYNGLEEIDYKSFDAVVILTIVSKIGKYIYDMLKNQDVIIIGNPENRLKASNKVYCALTLSANNIPTIKTVYSEGILPEEILSSIGKEVVMKPIANSEGFGIKLISNKNYVIEKNKLFQPYIECNSSDERWLVVGGKVVAVMKRTSSKKEEFRANLSLGGIGEAIVADDKTAELCKKAFNCFDGLVYAGIDIIRDKEGNPYIVEINSVPGEKIIKIANHNYYDDIAKYIIEKTIDAINIKNNKQCL